MLKLKLNLKGTRMLTSSATCDEESQQQQQQPKQQQRDDGRCLHIFFPAYWHAFWPDCAGHGRRLSAGVAIGGPTSQLQQKPAEPLAIWQRLVFSATASSRPQFGTTEADRTILNTLTTGCCSRSEQDGLQLRTID